MNPCNKQLKCPHIYKAVNVGGFRPQRKGCAPLSAAQRLSLSVSHPYQYYDLQSSDAKQLPSSNPPMSQTLPVSTGIYFQPSRFLSICSRNPLAILCPDGRLQMKGTGSWRVFSWPASQQPAGTQRQAESCTDKALLHCKSPSIPLHSFPQCPLCLQTNLS